MRPLELGLPLPTIGFPANKGRGKWEELKPIAVKAEEIGFDTLWLPDELLWKFPPDFTPMGTWECVAMTSAVAAVTERVKVGTWVLSALHRNPGLTVKVAETIDDIAAGRFVFGLGAGHSGGQGKAFGYPAKDVVSRYEEALRIIVTALREGQVTFEGEYHSAFELDLTPRGPRGAEMPIMLAGHGPRTIGLAVEYGDIWSTYALESSLPDAFTDVFSLADEICSKQGRDPDGLGRSVGVFVELTQERVVEETGLGVPLRGSPGELAQRVHEFAEMGVTMLEMIPMPFTDEALERFAEMISILDA